MWVRISSKSVVESSTRGGAALLGSTQTFGRGLDELVSPCCTVCLSHWFRICVCVALWRPFMNCASLHAQPVLLPV